MHDAGHEPEICAQRLCAQHRHSAAVRNSACRARLSRYGLVSLTTPASRKAAANQQPRQMLLMTSWIRCSRASSSACSCFHSGVSRFGHGLISWGRAIEAVMSSAEAAGCVVRVAIAGSDDTSCSPRCGCWISARIATCLDAQPQRLAPIPINRRALPNRIIGGPLGPPYDGRAAIPPDDAFHPHVLGEHRGSRANASPRLTQRP